MSPGNDDPALGGDDGPAAAPSRAPADTSAMNAEDHEEGSASSPANGEAAAPSAADASGPAQDVAATAAAAAAATHDSNDDNSNGGGESAIEAKNPFDSSVDESDSAADPDEAHGEAGGGGGRDSEEPTQDPSFPTNSTTSAAAATPLPSSAPASPIIQKRSYRRSRTPPQTRPQASQAAAQAPQPQSSPFPKFEPFRPHAPAEDDGDDEDEWGDFDDGFNDEDRDAFPNEMAANNNRNNVELGMPGLGVDASNTGRPTTSSGRTREQRSSSLSNVTSILTVEDIEICQRLDEEFDRALEEREIGWTARYNSVRQCACLSLTFMAIYLVLGTWFFFQHTDWALNDTLLFTIYTITTVGYGNHDIPDTPGVQTFIIFFIFVGIATLTIMVAQVYQCVVLETTRAQYSRDKTELSRHRQQSGHLEPTSGGAGRPTSSGINSRVSSTHGSNDEPWAVDFDSVTEGTLSCGERMLRDLDRTRNFLRHTQVGRGVSVLLPFAGLILIGAAVVGPIEGWTFIESIYFAVVSLTTVGFGDYFPTKNASTWFCIFWLPFSVGFMSLYLGGVAHFYIQLSNSNVQRLERQMRRRIRRAKEWAEKERQQASARVEGANAAKRKKEQNLEVESDDGDGVVAAAQDHEKEGSLSKAAAVTPSRKVRRNDFFQTLPSGDLPDDDEEEAGVSVGVIGKQRVTVTRSHHFGSPDSSDNIGARRRERIIENARRCDEFQNGDPLDGSDIEGGDARPRGRTMTTMRDVICTVHGHIKSNTDTRGQGSKSGTLASIMSGDVSVSVAPETELMSIRSSSRVAFSGKKPSERKPSFALRVLVQERFAEIIAIEIAGYQTHVDIQDNTMSITIDRLKTTLDKWMIPRRARKAFRSVSFETLYFVGERGLITRGADSLYDLTPFEFHSLFAPLLAAMGDADTMEGWLDNTNVLAEVDLKKDGMRSSNLSSLTSTQKRPSERLAVVHERHQSNVSSVTPSANTYRRHVTVPGNAFKNKSAVR